MSRWSISRQLYAGFGIVLLALAITGTLGFLSARSLGGVFLGFRTAADRTELLNAMLQDMFEARMAAMAYRRLPSEARAAEVESNIAEVMRDSARLADLFAGDPAALAELEAKLADIRKWLEGFRQLSERLVKIDQSLPRQDVALGEVAGGLSSIPLPPGAAQLVGRTLITRAGEALQNARLHLMEFQATHDPTAAETASAYLAQAIESLQKLGGNLTDRAELDGMLTRLRGVAQELPALARLQAEANALGTETLDGLGPRIVTAIDAVLDRIEERQAALADQGAATVGMVRNLMLALPLAALLIGALGAWFLARHIVRGIEGMVARMSRLAEGDLEVDIPRTGLGRELAGMAAALETFRDNARRVARLAEEKAEVDRRAAQERERMLAELRDAFGAVVEAAEAGEFNRRVRTDFPEAALNEMATAINRLVETVGRGVGFTLDAMQRLSNGNLTIARQKGFRGAFARMEESIAATVSRLGDLVASIDAATDEVGAAARTVAAGAQDLSARVEQQASAIEETAATMEEMSATVKANAESAATASDLAADATRRADRGREVVEQAVRAMSQIEEGARKIADIISVIDGIAFQTNLLALNAAVEAARAGEAGKGFAVVASEVRSLAQRSSEAARDIRELIESSSTQVASGVQLVEQTGAALGEIVDAIRKVAATIDDITAASREQASGIGEISSAISHMDQMTQQNAALAQESAAAGRKMENEAAELHRLIGFFRTAERAPASGALDAA
ncbi:MAG: hypothetical protein KatS3mg118_0890 [Paracoccaceae bacterium]|nr:MAG: hypothetical protein KatS3mg118_0890 [Paracoccaceae bacterium]